MILFLTFILGAAGADFDALMGKGTKHWAHLTKTDEVTYLEQYRELYEKNQQFLEEPAADLKIPKTVHFIWLGPRPFPPLSVENVRTWMAQHPDWKFIFWTDRDRATPCTGMEVRHVANFPFLTLQQCFHASQNWGEKSDILRYEILFQEGGLYVDHDANCLHSFENLHRGYDFYCCLEAPHPPFAGRNLTAGIGLIGSRPGHPIVKNVIGRIARHWESVGEKYPGSDGFSRTQLVIERTYMPLTDALRESLDQEGNRDIVLPASYFFAKSGLRSLYSEHFYGNTWAGGKMTRTQQDKSFSMRSQF